MQCCWHSRVVSRRWDTETSEGQSFAYQSGEWSGDSWGVLTVDGQLPLESDHSRCSGLVHYCDRRWKETQPDINAYSRGWPYLGI